MVILELSPFSVYVANHYIKLRIKIIRVGIKSGSGKIKREININGRGYVESFRPLGGLGQDLQRFEISGTLKNATLCSKKHKFF